MAISINGSTNVITGVAVGGLPDGVVDTDMLAASAVTAAKASGSVKGITMADIWRVTAQFTTGTGYTTLTSNWERADTGNSGKIGTGMTESSGVFTYPSTGIYLVQFGAWGNAGANGSAHTVGHNIQSTVDNGSNYTYDAGMYYSIPNVSTYSYNGGTCQHMFDVTDVSTHKSRMAVYSSSNLTWEAATTGNNIYVSFIRLGDT